MKIHAVETPDFAFRSMKELTQTTEDNRVNDIVASIVHLWRAKRWQCKNILSA